MQFYFSECRRKILLYKLSRPAVCPHVHSFVLADGVP